VQNVDPTIYDLPVLSQRRSTTESNVVMLMFCNDAKCIARVIHVIRWTIKWPHIFGVSLYGTAFDTRRSDNAGEGESDACGSRAFSLEMWSLFGFDIDYFS
jgi:hypothetical protein